MSTDVNANASPVESVTAPLVPAVAQVPGAQAQRPTAIQLIEQEIASFVKQREQAIANVHALEGAIQASQLFLAKFQAEAAKAVAEAKKLLDEAGTEVKETVQEVKAEAVKVETVVVDEVKKIEQAL